LAPLQNAHRGIHTRASRPIRRLATRQAQERQRPKSKSPPSPKINFFFFLSSFPSLTYALFFFVLQQLVNHTLSQSVPPSVVTTVSGFTKVLIGELVERARDVQLEWQAASSKLPTGTPLADNAPLAERLRDCDRGPLTPDHLREALRRYKKDRDGGCAGFLGLSLRGPEVVAARMRGKRLFR
jgi:hypothetical protein